MIETDHIDHPVIKGLLALLSFVSLHWFDWLTGFGKFCAAATAIVIFAEWLWKKVIRPLMRRYEGS